MSEPLRLGFAAGLILACLSTSPASSNPFTALFSSTPEQAAEPAPAKDAPAREECLGQPGKPADGQHWVYRLDGHRKCWYLRAEGTIAAKKPVRRTAAKQRLDADGDNAALPRREAVEDARAELLRPLPAETPQPAPPAPAANVVDAADAAPVPATGAAAMVPPPPVLSKSDLTKPDDSNSRASSTETLLAATPADDSDATAVSVPAVSPVAVPIDETNDERRWWTAPWLGPLLMALGGLILLLSPAWPRRRIVLVAEGSWSAEWDRPDLPRSDFDPRMRPRDRRHMQATPRPRQTIEDRRRLTPRS